MPGMRRVNFAAGRGVYGKSKTCDVMRKNVNHPLRFTPYVLNLTFYICLLTFFKKISKS